jgi:DNA-binding response OmpR family regulator
MKALVLDDDPKVARFVALALREEGYAVDQCTSGVDALRLAEVGRHELIVLDWMVRDVDGLSVCRELRRRGVVAPILMISARSRVSERVLGLDTGADDFLVKPFDVEELCARARALVRRTLGYARLRCGDLEIDRLERQVFLDGRRLDLTSRELSLLLRLALHQGQVVKRTHLMASVWETSFDSGSNLLDVHVSRLRDKMGEHASMIETVRGVGYRLRARTPTTRLRASRRLAPARRARIMPLA